MKKKLLKFSLVCVTGVIILTANPKSAKAFEEAVAGYTHDKDIISTTELSIDKNVITSFSTDAIPLPGFNNIGIANVDTNLLIRKGPGEDQKIIGKLPKNGGCTILEKSKKGWTKVSSGKLTGYVKSEYLITGEKAQKLAFEIATRVATSNTNGLRVRKSPSIDAEVLDTVALNEELIVLDPLVVSYGQKYNKWVKVSLDSEDSEDGTVGYIAKEFVDLSYELIKANSLEELIYGSGVSSKRVNLVNFAKDYLGYRYVWGGNSLKYGVDCSGFTQQVYKNFGLYIPRTSRSQAASGTKVSSSNVKPGDLVFYGSSSYINHVAIYIGNGKVIHASNKRDGIKISNMYYRQPVKCVRYISD